MNDASADERRAAAPPVPGKGGPEARAPGFAQERRFLDGCEVTVDNVKVQAGQD